MDKESKIAFYDSIAEERDLWRSRNSYYYNALEKLICSIVPQGQKVLEIGCDTGDLLAKTKPSYGLGIDFSSEIIKIAKRKYPDLDFRIGDAEHLEIKEKFDYVVMSNLVGDLTDIWSAFRQLQNVINEKSRIIITYYNYLWQPVLNFGEKIRMKMSHFKQNWLSQEDIQGLFEISGFEVIKKGYKLIFPKRILILSTLLNRVIANLPIINRLCLIQYLIARGSSQIKSDTKELSCSVIIPTRNEAGNIEECVERIPEMGSHTELIFVDGNSSDGTVEIIESIMEKSRGRKDIKLIHQIDPKTEEFTKQDLNQKPEKMLKLGKGDAVRKGFDAARGDILMILDSDLTVAPEDLPKFYLSLAEGTGEFINGSRLVYPIEKGAMRSLNILANKLFSVIFTWLIGQRIKDTLCGTKALFKKDYKKIKKNRKFFGDLDPYGDFDLLFGSSKLNLKIAEIPVKYKRRTYGNVKIERFKHGILLLKMLCIALKRLKLTY